MVSYNKPRLQDIEISLLGAGRAASTLARLWSSRANIRIGQVVNSGYESARLAVRHIGAGQAMESFSKSDTTASTRLLMLGLPDGLLGQLQDVDWQIPADQFDGVFHLSGQYGAEILEPLGLNSTRLASAHPVMPFANPQLAQQLVADSYCVITANDQAFSGLLQLLFESLGMQVIKAPAALDRARYHSAMVVASNLSCVLQNLAITLANQAGLDQSQAQQLSVNLGQKALQSIQDSSPAEALTGPIERGDVAACKRLFNAVQSLDTAQTQVLLDLFDQAISLAAAKGSLNPQQADSLRELLR